MNVRTLCLAVLFDTEASGYEIRKQSTGSYFVEASFGSIYPALAKLEDEGLVTSRIENQEGRPAKKVYSITEAGRSELLDAMFQKLDPDVFRSEFLLFCPLCSASAALAGRGTADGADCPIRRRDREFRAHGRFGFSESGSLDHQLRKELRTGCAQVHRHPYARISRAGSPRYQRPKRQNSKITGIFSCVPFGPTALR